MKTKILAYLTLGLSVLVSILYGMLQNAQKKRTEDHNINLKAQNEIIKNAQVAATEAAIDGRGKTDENIEQAENGNFDSLNDAKY